MNAMVEDPLIGECEELACDKCEGYRLELLSARAQVALLKAELAKTRCSRHDCNKPLHPDQSFEVGERGYCDPTCWIAEKKYQARDLEW